MNTAIAKTYDETPYQGVAYQQTHPKRLATLASLLGVPFSPPDHSRILDLGCAEGGNIIPMAVEYPHSEFLGIDLSGKQIDDGNQFVQELGIQNIRLEQQDIMNFSSSEGKFDYIIIHGIYSWVPKSVRQKVLNICRDHLSDTGLAFISYNAYPGGHVRSMVRDMLKFHSRNKTDGQEKVQKVREFYDILLDTVPDDSSMYSSCLRWEEKHVKDVPDHSVRHETLSDINESLYFTDFMKEAGSNDLQYVGDLRFASMFPIQCSEENYQKFVSESKNRIEYEQYLDFVNFRVFRETVLRKKNNQPEIALNFDFNLLKKYFYSTQLQANTPSNSSEPIQFVHLGNGKEVKTGSPVVQSIFLQMIESWPEAVSFESLENEILRKYPDTDTKNLSAQLSQVLFEFYKKELIDLSLFPVDCSKNISSHPQASLISRKQLSQGLSITNQKHDLISLNEIQKLLLPLLTGQNNHQQLLNFLLEQVENGSIQLENEGKKLNAGDPLFNQQVEHLLKANLNSIAQLGLLIKS